MWRHELIRAGATGLFAHLDHQMAELQGVEIGSADAAREGAHEDLTWSGRGLGDVVDDELLLLRMTAARTVGQ